MAKITGAMGGGGSKGGSARAPVIAPDSIRSQAIVEVVEAICEGEIEGFVTADPLESIYLDETPLKSNGTSNFNGISVDYRLGTQTQSYIPGQEEDAAATPISVGVNVTNANPVIRTISDNTTDAVRVTVKFAALYQVNASNGDKNGVAVSLSIEVKPAGGYWQTVDLKGRGTINDKTESPYQRNFTVKLKDYGDANSYDIRVSRVSADPTSSQSSAFQWESYTKLSYAKLRYPNTVIIRLTFDSQHFSSMPSRGYYLKGRKVKVPPPSVYNPVTRQYSGADWDGTFTVAWTRCPAWIFYDLITEPRAGLGDLINPAYLDKWNLYQIAKRCDEQVPDGFGGTECRYSLDLYLQDSNRAKQVVLDIASGFDSMGFWTSGGIYTTQDAPKPVSALFTPANVVGGQFQYTGSARQMRYTVAMVQWNDPTDNYRISTEYVEDIEGIARYGYREKQVAAIGCTNRGQAHRLGKRILLTSRLETDAVAFSVGLDGISCKPGDIVRIADPLRASHNRYGGRVKTGSTVSTVLLDAPVTLAASTIYKIAVIKADGSVIESTVTNGASSTDSVTVSPALTDLPEVDAAFIVYSPAESGKLYRILGISENADTSNGFYSVSAVQYAPEKYAQIDSLAALPPLPDNPYTNVRAVIPPSGVVVTDGTYVGIEGLQRFIDISWTQSNDPLLRAHKLSWSKDGGAATIESVVGQTYRINNPKQGVYKISLMAENIIGATSPTVEISYTLGELYLIEAVHITNLALPSGTTAFVGKDAFFSWQTDADTVLGQSSYATGKGGQSPWFRDFEVRIYDGSTLLRTEYVTEYYYSYTFEKNIIDHGNTPKRTFTIKVQARDYYGRYSQQSQLTVSNPPPSDYSAFTLTAGQGQIFVNYNQPTDPDYLLTRIYASQTSGFTPSEANLVAEANTRVTGFPAAEGTWYVRLQGVDEFGLVGTVYSTETAVTVAVADVADAVNTLLSTPARGTDFLVEASRFLVTLNDGTGAKTVFGIGTVNGVTQVGIKGDLLIDGTVYGQALVAHSVTADRMNVSQLSAITADMGTVTAGTFKTSNLNSGWRTEISDSGDFPYWYGTGAKTSANALMYMDKYGNMMYRGSLNVNNRIVASADGNLTIKDANGNVVMSSGGAVWDYVTGANKPANNADVTNYSDARVSNVIEENNTLLVSRPIGASYANEYPAVTGMIRIILPQGFTNTMMKFTVNVYTYNSDKSFSLHLAGYNYQPISTWYNTEANLIGSTAADNRVRFGYDSTLGKCCIYIGEPTSSWSYPKVMVKDFIAGYSNFARSQWETGWAIDIVTSAPQLVTQDYADALIDAASIKNQGAFATLNKVTAGNASTYIADAAIGNAQIDRASVNKLVVNNADIDRASANKLKVVTADIVDANVSTLKIAGNAVTVPLAVYTEATQPFTVANSWHDVQSLVIPVLSTTESLDLLISFGCVAGTISDGYNASIWQAGFFVNTTQVYGNYWRFGYYEAGYIAGSASIKYTLPANTSVTLYFKAQTAIGGSYRSRFISVLGVKR